MGFWRIVVTIILPSLSMLLGKRFGWAFIINILLTPSGYIPGLTHAFWVQTYDQTCAYPRGVDAPRSSATLSECFR